MGYIKLNPRDAAKLGVPERIDFDIADIGIRQRAAVERNCKRTIRWMFNALQGVPELDEAGNAIPVPVLDDDGKQEYEDDGVTPKMEPLLRRDPDALAMFVYLGLWGAGHRLDWDTFDIHGDVEINNEDEPSEGKDEPPVEAMEPASTTIA